MFAFCTAGDKVLNQGPWLNSEKHLQLVNQQLVGCTKTLYHCSSLRDVVLFLFSWFKPIKQCVCHSLSMKLIIEYQHTKLWVSRPYSNGKNSPCAPRPCLYKRINNKEYLLAGINHFTGIIGHRCSWSKIDQLAVYVVRNSCIWETEWARQHKQDRAWKTAGEMGISRCSKIYPERCQISF